MNPGGVERATRAGCSSESEVRPHRPEDALGDGVTGFHILDTPLPGQPMNASPEPAVCDRAKGRKEVLTMPVQ